MYIVRDTESDEVIGPFEFQEDAVSFITRVERASNYAVVGLEAIDMSDPEDWMTENLDDLTVVY